MYQKQVREVYSEHAGRLRAPEAIEEVDAVKKALFMEHTRHENEPREQDVSIKTESKKSRKRSRLEFESEKDYQSELDKLSATYPRKRPHV